MKNLYSLVASAVAAFFTSVALCAPLPSYVIPVLPLDAEGRIEITGMGESDMTREEMMPLIMEWIRANMDNFSVEEDADAGLIRAAGTFLIAEDELYEGTRSLEFMDYSVTVACSDNAFSYRIGDANVYVATVVCPYGFYPSENMPYEVVEISPIEIPHDYILLIDNSYGQRAELRSRLEELLAQDMSDVSRGKRRRFERELEETAVWFANVDEYYHTVCENYMACHDFLTGMVLSLEDILWGCGRVVEDLYVPQS